MAAALLTLVPPCTVCVDRSVCRSDRRAGGRAGGGRSGRAGQGRRGLNWPGLAIQHFSRRIAD